MKIRILLSLVLSTLLFLSGCANKENEITYKESPNEIIYFGKTEEWLATYSVFKVRNSSFDSIYIQNIGEDRETKKGPIEYLLVGGEGYRSESSFPQELQGVRSFHTSSEVNSDVFSIMPNNDGVFTLTIKYNGKTEIITLAGLNYGER